jgi:hypothetical protein
LKFLLVGEHTGTCRSFNDLLSVDTPVTSFQALLGHRWLETTQIYVQANDRQVESDYYAACLKLEGWLLLTGSS